MQYHGGSIRARICMTVYVCIGKYVYVLHGMCCMCNKSNNAYVMNMKMYRYYMHVCGLVGIFLVFIEGYTGNIA